MNQKDINNAVDFLYTKGTEYAQAKAHLTYVEEYRKTLKALLMQQAMENGTKSVSAAEIEAYADIKYQEHLTAIKEAVEAAEALRWHLVSAQARIDVWRSLEASNRSFDKIVS